jgi:hypothetical protein
MSRIAATVLRIVATKSRGADFGATLVETRCRAYDWAIDDPPRRPKNGDEARNRPRSRTE